MHRNKFAQFHGSAVPVSSLDWVLSSAAHLGGLVEVAGPNTGLWSSDCDLIINIIVIIMNI